jgi:hypothetical protein
MSPRSRASDSYRALEFPSKIDNHLQRMATIRRQRDVPGTIEPFTVCVVVFSVGSW